MGVSGASASSTPFPQIIRGLREIFCAVPWHDCDMHGTAKTIFVPLRMRDDRREDRDTIHK